MSTRAWSLRAPHGRRAALAAAGVALGALGLALPGAWWGGFLVGLGLALATVGAVSRPAPRASEGGGGRRRRAWESLSGQVPPGELRRRWERGVALAPERPRALLLVAVDDGPGARARWGEALFEAHFQAVTRAVQGCLSTRDSLSRVGRDELAALLDHAAPGTARRVGRAVCDAVRAVEGEWGGPDARITASIGIAAPEPQDALDDLIARAAAAAARARAAGGDRCATRPAPGPVAGEAVWAPRWQRALESGSWEVRLRELPALAPGAAPWALLAAALPGAGPERVPPPSPWAEAGERVTRELDRGLLQRAIGWDGRLPDGRRAVHACVPVGRAFLEAPDRDDWLGSLPRAHPAAVPVTVLVTEADAAASPGSARALGRALAALGVGVGLREWGAGLGGFALPGLLGARVLVLAPVQRVLGAGVSGAQEAALLGWARAAAEAAGVEAVIAEGAPGALAQAGIPRALGAWLEGGADAGGRP